MNVRSMKTAQLFNRWGENDDKTDEAIWNELYRRVGKKNVYYNCFAQWSLQVLSSGMKVVCLTHCLDPKDVDKEFIETLPQPMDGLAFEPSDELDAATLAT